MIELNNIPPTLIPTKHLESFGISLGMDLGSVTLWERSPDRDLR